MGRQEVRKTMMPAGKSQTLEKLRELLGEIEVVTRAANQQAAQDAPGMLERHYSPATRVVLFPNGTLPVIANLRSAVLFLGRRAHAPANADVFLLSEAGSTEEAAHNLFDLLRQLDADLFETQPLHIGNCSEYVFA